MTAIWWVRRDLRLVDNPALATALGHGGVVPVFVMDPAVLNGRSHGRAARRKAFLFAGLQALDERLRARGSRLIVRQGQPLDVLASLSRETGAEVVVAARDCSPYAGRRDDAVGRALNLTLTEGVYVRAPEAIVREDGAPFRVFTAYKRTWLRGPPGGRELLAAPDRIPAVPPGLGSEQLPEGDPPEEFPAGEEEALRRLSSFAKDDDAPIDGYDSGRNRLDLENTSALSPYLRFGMLSPRLAAVTALERQGAGPAAWLNELVWRDFYLSILFHFPGVLRSEMDQRLAGIEWRRASADLEAWKSGETGVPVVDAAMRQLSTTGWMHNRARMIVASFLVKHLLIDWREGEAWFMEQLIDGDPAANNGGWQWTAGTGTDAQPYFRVFNPVLQAKRFDPEGAFVRRWLPALAAVPQKFIHEPWRMPLSVQAGAGVRIGRDYPASIVDLSEGRQRALAAYRRARERTSASQRP